MIYTYLFELDKKCFYLFFDKGDNAGRLRDLPWIIGRALSEI